MVKKQYLMQPVVEVTEKVKENTLFSGGI